MELFTEEEKLILKQRETRRLRRLSLLKEIKNTNNSDKLAELWKEYHNTDSERCEHDRSIWSSCSACFEIEQKLEEKNESD